MLIAFTEVFFGGGGYGAAGEFDVFIPVGW